MWSWEPHLDLFAQLLKIALELFRNEQHINSVSKAAECYWPAVDKEKETSRNSTVLHFS